MKITVWMVILSENGLEEYYVDMALKAVMPYANGIFIQDQGSPDNTVSVIKETIGEQVPYCIDIQKHGLPRFSPDYNEPYYRSLAMEMAEKAFPENDWLLQVDSDDYYTPYFFETVKQLNETGELKPYNSVRHGGARFVTPEYSAQRGDNSLGIRQEHNGFSYLDPHTRLWRYGLGVKYIENPAFKDSEYHFLHCVLEPEPVPVYWLPGLCDIHLHRMFGPKAWKFWEEGGDKFERTTPFNPRTQAPQWFNDVVNMGDAVYTAYDWPEFVMEKWREWGRYD